MKPKRIVLKSDDQKRLVSEAFEVVRLELAPKIGGNVNDGVRRVAEAVNPRALATVTVAELRDLIPKLVAKFAEESKQRPDNGGRLPLNDEAQADWDAGVYKGQLTIHGLRQRYAAEIADGVDITRSMLQAYVAELAVEKTRIAELVAEHDDPDIKLVACGSPVHRGDNTPFQPTIRFRLHRNDAGELARMKHPQGDDFIEVGNFLVVPGDEEEKTTDRAVSYCPDCREAAWAYGREHETKVTFYTVAGAQRKLGKMKESAEGNAAFASQLKSAGARSFGGAYGSRKTWKTDRNWSRGGRK